MYNIRYKQKIRPLFLLGKGVGFFWFGAGDRGRTGTVSPPPDFESGTSANSITPAGIHNECIIHDSERKIKRKFCIGR